MSSHLDLTFNRLKLQWRRKSLGVGGSWAQLEQKLELEVRPGQVHCKALVWPEAQVMDSQEGSPLAQSKASLSQQSRRAPHPGEAPLGRTGGSWICSRGRLCWFSSATRLLFLPELLWPTDS